MIALVIDLHCSGNRVARNCVRYDEAVGQRQDYVNENCREIQTPKEGNLEGVVA